MSHDFLNRIIDFKRVDIDARRPYLENLRAQISRTEYVRYSVFKRQISRPGMNLIAEIKKASPSKGVIRDDFSVEGLARAYEEAGAAAISVLTEEKYFLGRPAYLKTVSEKFHTPTLMKDFIIDELQLFEARYCGASAILLIVAILDDGRLKALLDQAHALDLDVLVEIHNEEELVRALQSGAEIIGINNRDLRTFNVDIAVSERIIPQIPKGKVIVAESGIRTYDEVKRLAEAGAHAVLIGETFLKERDVARKVLDVMGR
ncbi:MAG: indole-3-glycerol phosphate synthase TrpC [Candidatus Omnitrophica bacterium]|nr:indole-3-glycerol phosphate synthase TrpC [Candidatus Omnitrophota bacterium]